MKDTFYYCSLIAILLFIKLLEHCNNDYVMFDRYMSFDMRINNKQAMMTLQGMADHRFTSVSLFTNVFLGKIIFFPLNFFPLIFVY